jgi:hypothetical protein
VKTSLVEPDMNEGEEVSASRFRSSDSWRVPWGAGGGVYSVDFKFNDNCLTQSWDDFHLINIKKCIVILKSTDWPHPQANPTRRMA